jgi:putative endonuclease
MAAAYTYILQCADGRLYYGSTNDLRQRLARHRSGRVHSTKWRLPVRLVYFEKCQTLEQAKQREHAFKNGRTRRKAIDALISRFPASRLALFA